jgi:chromosome segregation ATPase
MKSNLFATILLLACLALGVVLWNQHVRNTEQTNNLDNTIQSFSNKVTEIRGERDWQTASNELLRATLNAAQIRASNELTEARIKLITLSNNLEKLESYSVLDSNTIFNLNLRIVQQNQTNSSLLTQLSATQAKAANDAAAADSKLAATLSKLESAESDARAAKAAADKADADIAEKDKQIAKLELQNADLDKQSNDLLASMTNLQARAAAAEKRLASSDKDHALLESEINLIESQKEDLQRKFNDVAALKAQIKSVQNNIVIARRVEWIERGLYQAIGDKGGKVLISAPMPSPTPTNISLNVELDKTGGVRINSTLPTNAPSTNKPTARAPSNR